MTGFLPAAGPETETAQSSPGLTDARLPVWMHDRVCGNEVMQSSRTATGERGSA